MCGLKREFDIKDEIELKIQVTLTLPSIRFPAVIGARSPAKFAVQLVIAIKIPAKRGVMSKWLILKPE